MSRTTQFEAIQGIVLGLHGVRRRHYLPSTDERETVAEHTLSVASLAWYLHQLVGSATDLNRVVKYAIVHDFVEVYAGDVNTFASADARAAKEIREQNALARFAEEFRDFPDMLAHMQAYQERADSEVQFVWTTDKIQALILGKMDMWRTYHEQGISLEAFSGKMQELMAKASPELIGLFENLVAECKETYEASVYA